MQQKSASLARGGKDFKHHVACSIAHPPPAERINFVTPRSLPLLFIQMKANKPLNLFYFHQQ